MLIATNRFTNYEKPEDQKTTATNSDLLLIMRNPEDQKTATNADLPLIMRNPEDQKTTATNADLLLIMLNLKTKKQLQQMQIYF